ncbi:MAG: ATP-binding cassette domain-containing protein [Clostridia bacterium]|nr:ATP-binding cassette domain-containing protein [Clostridia bacterium]
MITVNNVSIQFGSRKLFEDVNLKFTKGNCYGIIGANGAGKSTFLRIISGDLEPTSGNVEIGKRERLSVLQQNQEAYNDQTVLKTVLLGHKRLCEIMDEKEVLYNKADFTDEDGVRLGELEAEFADLDGWNAEAEAETLLQSIGIPTEFYDKLMGDIDSKVKVKVLLAQALFSNPENLILDEPTNNLDVKTIRWLEDYLMNFEGTILIVSHNRHFLNKVCTNICDIDYNKISLFVGNYDFWYESSQLALRQQKEANKKAEQRAKELQEFIARFSANASKSKQATSRKKELEKLTIEDIKPSTRKYPFINFEFEQRIGNEILYVKNLAKEGLFSGVTFTIQKGEKVAFLSDNSAVTTALFNILSGEDKDFSGHLQWGKTINHTYLPQNNNEYFENCDLSLIDWLSQYSKEHEASYLRGWLGRMLFTGEESTKKAKVISGGERVRCMLARMMLKGGNVLLMDEPTNHLDLEAITALNTGMQKFQGNILFTTHDEEILSTVANRIIRINATKEYDKETTYEEYVETELK